MAILEINKAKAKTKSGKWFTFEVESIEIINNDIVLVPKNKKYQYLKIYLSNCIIIK